ncbi:MAG: bifunctional oligoribonuclease/PAP phosphatase NrnA [Anaerolineales bacterium]|jgi:phosphoesterase RecJ-like protein
MMNKDLVEQTRQKIEQAQRVLVCSHTRPDGDAIGSLLALGQALQDAGKYVQMVSEDGVPSALRFLPGSEQIRNHPEDGFDLVIVVDSSKLDRVGAVLDEVDQIDINIDHHPDNSQFAQINLVDAAAVSTTQILTRLLPAFGLEISPVIAADLLTGMITDTIGFKTDNMHPEVLRMAAELYELGADLPTLYHNAVAAKTFEAARYMGEGLSQLKRQNGLIWTVLTLENRKNAKYPGRDDADLVNIISAIDSADVALIFVEQNPNQIKVSWRTRSLEIDVSKVAHQYGGGGHRAAAGAMIEGSLQDVQADVVQTTQRMIFKK